MAVTYNFSPDQSKSMTDLFSKMQALNSSGDEMGAKNLYATQRNALGFTDDQFSKAGTGGAYDAAAVTNWANGATYKPPSAAATPTYSAPAAAPAPKAAVTPLDEATRLSVIQQAKDRAAAPGGSGSAEQEFYKYIQSAGISNDDADTYMGWDKGGTQAWVNARGASDPTAKLNVPAPQGHVAGAAAPSTVPGAVPGATTPADYLTRAQGLVSTAQASNPAPAPMAPAASYQASQITVDPTKTTQGLINSMLSTDSPYLTRARNLAMEKMNDRGLLSSSLAQGAGVNAAIDAAGQIAGQDAGIYANAATSGANALNSAGQFNAGQQNDFSKTNYGAANERANLGLTSTVNLGNTALSGMINADQITQKSKAGMEEMKFGAGLDLNKMAATQGYNLTNMSEQAKIDMAKLVKTGDIQSVRDAFLQTAQDAMERYKTESTAATSRYNTDASARNNIDHDRQVFASGIISDRELTADRKAALLRGLGMDAEADAIMQPNEATMESDSLAYASLKNNPDSDYNKNANVKQTIDRRANAAILNIQTSEQLSAEKKKALLLRYGQTTLANMVDVTESVKADLTNLPVGGFMGNTLG